MLLVEIYFFQNKSHSEFSLWLTYLKWISCPVCPCGTKRTAHKYIPCRDKCSDKRVLSITPGNPHSTRHHILVYHE